MSSIRAIYSKISTIEQLRAERNSLSWHIKGIEKRMKDSICEGGSLISFPKDGNVSRLLPVIIPTAIIAFSLVRQINRFVRKIRNH